MKTEIEYSKRNEEIINKKYDEIVEELRKITADNNYLSLDSIEKEKEIVNAHVMMRENMNIQQSKIDDLSAKILPTISSAKIDEFIIKLREISNSKSQLEEQNQGLREKNFSLQMRNDYI